MGQILEIKGISKSYLQHPQLLDSVDLVLEQGEIVCLLGDSGQGKSTLLKIIAGIVQPDSGQIFFAGEDVTAKPAHERNFGFVFQGLALFPHLDVSGNIAFGLDMRKVSKQEKREKVRELLHLVKMPGFEGRKINELSGGQQQRVALARSLAYGPCLLLLDEPMSSLDPELKQHLLTEVKEIIKSIAVPTIYVTHDRQEASAIADRIVTLVRGRIQPS